MIPITKVVCGPEEESLVLQVVRSGMLASGSMVAEFEACCRAMSGAEHAVAVNNGTTALVVALEALQLQPGDEVITSPFTFVATLNAILESGATARFADISAEDFNIDAQALEAAISDRTRVVMPVHLYGQPADLDAVQAAGNRVGAVMVADAAQAHGATYKGVPVGATGTATFSFYATKNLHAGEGGVVTTDDAALADRIRVLRNQGMRARYHYEVPGHNYRLTDLAAAVAIPQFSRLNGIVDARAGNAAFYTEHLDGIAGLVTPKAHPDRGHAWHQYTLRVTAEAAVDRDTFVTRLNEAGIGAAVYYPRLVYDYACFRDHARVAIGEGQPVAQRVVSEVVSLPVHQHLTPSERDLVVAAVREAAR